MWNNSKQLPKNFAPIGESEYTAAPGVLFLHPGDGIFLLFRRSQRLVREEGKTPFPVQQPILRPAPGDIIGPWGQPVLAGPFRIFVNSLHKCSFILQQRHEAAAPWSRAIL